MRPIRTLIALSCVALGMGLGQVNANPIHVGIATEPYPPFAVPDSTGHYSGWEIDITRAVCQQAKLDCQFVATAWDGIIPSLLSGKVDMIAASLSITDERKKVIDFSDKYYQTGASLAVGRGSNLKPTEAGLAGKKIGVQSGSIHQAYALKHFKSSVIKEYQTQDEADQDLFAGRIDGTLADTLVLADFLKTDEGQACCTSVGRVADDDAILGKGIGFGVRKGQSALLKKLNQAIASIRKNGTYDRITKRYFAFNIYGD